MGAHLEIPPTLSTPLPPFSRPPTSPSLITCTLTHIHSRGPKSTYTSFHFIPPTSWSPTTSQIKNFWVLTTPSLGKAAPFLFFSLKWAYFFLRILQTKNILKSECAPWETPPSPLVSHASHPHGPRALITGAWRGARLALYLRSQPKPGHHPTCPQYSAGPTQRPGIPRGSPPFVGGDDTYLCPDPNWIFRFIFFD